jgi:hypothetical protein
MFDKVYINDGNGSVDPHMYFQLKTTKVINSFFQQNIQIFPTRPGGLNLSRHGLNQESQSWQSKNRHIDSQESLETDMTCWEGLDS